MQAKAAELDLRKSHLEYLNQRRLSRDISRRTTREQIAALNMTQFAIQNVDLDLGSNELEKLLYTLEVCCRHSLHVEYPLMPSSQAEAPPELVDDLDEAEATASRRGRLKSLAHEVPPSPPASSDHIGDAGGTGSKRRQLGERDRQILARLQRYISMKLGADPTQDEGNPDDEIS